MFDSFNRFVDVNQQGRVSHRNKNVSTNEQVMLQVFFLR